MNTVLKIVPKERTCNVCKESKPLAEFHVDKTGTYGRKSRCIICCNKVQRERDYPKDKRGGGYKGRPDVVLRKYGVTYEHIVRTFDNQHGLCANHGCGKEISLTDGRGVNKAMIDHDHATGEFRGLLCMMCNLYLGTIEKDLNKVLGLFEYLKTHKKRN